MKQIKDVFKMLLVALMLTSTIGCSKQSNEQKITKIATGYGGDVEVTVTFKDGNIINVEVLGDNETPNIGSRAIEALPAKIVAANSSNIDGISGATVTSKAILQAVSEAILEASGETADIPNVKMIPGTYSVSAKGFSLIKPLTVDVTVSETEILGIEIKDNGETYPFVSAAAEKIIPRILDNQSVAIDSITGVTSSSNGIKQATEEAILLALQAAGCDKRAIQNFYTKPAKSELKETIEVDVLVVGMGGSGTAAAMSAVETMVALGQEVSVLAIDKAGKYGGTSSITADTMGINAPVYQQKYHGGVDYVDADAMMKDWIEFTKGDAKQEILELFFDESGHTIDWLIEHGFDYGAGTEGHEGWGYGGPQRGFTEQDIFHVKFQYTGQGYGNWKKETGAMFDNIVDDYVALGGEYMLEVEAQSLIYDAQTNAVIGVNALGYDGTEYTIYAKSIIMGTGGFSNNAQLQNQLLTNEYYPLQGSWLMYGMQQNDGKLFESALEIGAATYNEGMPPMVHLQGAPVTIHQYPVEVVAKDENDIGFWTKLPRTNSLNDFPNALANAGYALQLNMAGQRFSNEAGTFQTWKAGPRYITVWSQDFFDDVKQNGLPVAFADDLTCQGGIDAGVPITEMEELLELCLELNIAYKADSLEELASQLNIDPATLVESVNSYNAIVEAQNDTEYGKDASHLIMQIADNGPYYAFVGASYIYSTVGGLDVNTDLQVLDPSGSVINGLYAVGTDSLGTLFSEQKEYVTYGGAAQGWAYTSGRLAGINAVRNIVE